MWKNNIVYAFRTFQKRVLPSKRFIAALFIFSIVNFVCFNPAATQMNRDGYQIGVLEFVPFYMCNNRSILIYYIVFLFIASGFPNKECAYSEIVRMGKRNWIIKELLTLFLSSIVLYIFLTISLVIDLFPALVWNNKWNNFTMAAAEDPMVITKVGLNISMGFPADLMAMGTPVSLYFCEFILHTLCCTLIGFILVFGNLRARRYVGTLISLGLVLAYEILVCMRPDECSSTLFALIGNVGQYGLIPLFQADLSQLFQHSTGLEIHLRLALSFLYFAVCNLLTWYVGVRKFKKQELNL
jgi:hypothetical protein